MTDVLAITLHHPSLVMTALPSAIEGLPWGNSPAVNFDVRVDERTAATLATLVGEDSLAMVMSIGHQWSWSGYVWLTNYRRLPSWSQEGAVKVQLSAIPHAEYRHSMGRVMA